MSGPKVKNVEYTLLFKDGGSYLYKVSFTSGSESYEFPYIVKLMDTGETVPEIDAEEAVKFMNKALQQAYDDMERSRLTLYAIKRAMGV